MRTTRTFPKLFVLTLLLTASLAAAQTASAPEPAMYAVAFVASPAVGRAMNDQDIAVGTRFRLPPGCTPSTCAPVSEEGVWSGQTFTPLPLLSGFTTITAVSINAAGWIAGYAGDPTAGNGRAVVWKPTGSGYTAINLGVLPNTTISWAAGIDNFGRAVGWSTTGGIPTAAAPFVWTESGGLANLVVQGFPNDIPLAISPAGAVATSGYWYRLGDPSSVAPLAPPPPGFSGPGTYPTAINDAGNQARFQISTSSQRFPYLFRYHQAERWWQQLWSLPAGQLAPYGIGSINAGGDVTATVGGVGLVAYGPNGVAMPLAAKLSPAYGGGSSAPTTIVPTGGPINTSGKILARVIIGQSPRLVRLTPTRPCTTGCIRVTAIQMAGKMVGNPPGQCNSTARNYVKASITVRDATGSAVANATVRARFLDSYYLNKPVVGVTSATGTITFNNEGPACVGSVAFFIDNVTAVGRVLDFTTGELADSVIPRP